MTVSGLGSAPMPHSYPGAPVRAPRADKPSDERNVFDSLTAGDRELIFQVTGQRLAPGFDPTRESATTFAATLAAERAAGRLAPGQEATGVYLKDLNRRFERSGTANPLAGHLDKAVAYLASSGARSIDVTA